VTLAVTQLGLHAIEITLYDARSHHNNLLFDVKSIILAAFSQKKMNETER
jgi:hypothetical protein